MFDKQLVNIFETIDNEILTLSDVSDVLKNHIRKYFKERKSFIGHDPLLVTDKRVKELFAWKATQVVSMQQLAVLLILAIGDLKKIDEGYTMPDRHIEIVRWRCYLMHLTLDFKTHFRKAQAAAFIQLYISTEDSDLKKKWTSMVLEELHNRVHDTFWITSSVLHSVQKYIVKRLTKPLDKIFSTDVALAVLNEVGNLTNQEYILNALGILARYPSQTTTEQDRNTFPDSSDEVVTTWLDLLYDENGAYQAAIKNLGMVSEGLVTTGRGKDMSSLYQRNSYKSCVTNECVEAIWKVSFESKKEAMFMLGWTPMVEAIDPSVKVPEGHWLVKKSNNMFVTMPYDEFIEEYKKQ